MQPPSFDYYRAGSVAEALSLMEAHRGARFLAGGHSLLPLMKLRLADPGVLIDISRIDGLAGISRMNGRHHIGALTTHSAVAASSELPTALSQAASMIGDPQVRNRGTVGGNLAHADPASDLPIALWALDATIHITGRAGERRVNVADFFVDLFTTDLSDDELITAVTVDALPPGSSSGYAKLFHPASRYAIVGAAAVLDMADGVCRSARVAVGGLTPTPVRAPSVEAALTGTSLDDATVAAAAAEVAQDLGDDVMGDIHASADYRRRVAPVFIQRALHKAGATTRG